MCLLQGFRADAIVGIPSYITQFVAKQVSNSFHEVCFDLVLLLFEFGSQVVGLLLVIWFVFDIHTNRVIL